MVHVDELLRVVRLVGCFGVPVSEWLSVHVSGCIDIVDRQWLNGSCVR